MSIQKILVVDDDNLSRQFLVEAVKSLGFQVAIARDGKSGLAPDALADATCNARDFYPQGPEAFQQAQADRREMFRLLQLVEDYASQWEARAAEHLRG